MGDVQRDVRRGSGDRDAHGALRPHEARQVPHHGLLRRLLRGRAVPRRQQVGSPEYQDLDVVVPVKV